MTREELIQQFRDENPEITDRVITDTVLRTWCILGNQEICCRARLITGETTWAATDEEESYDLTSQITNFFDINEYPGGGVVYNNKRLKKRSKAEMDQLHPSWRSASSGTPTEYFREGKNIKLWKPPNIASGSTVYIIVDAVLIPDDFNDDAITPYNQLTHLEPFHYGIVKYLQWKAKEKVGKREDGQKAMSELNDYILYIKKEIGGGRVSVVHFIPKVN